MHHPLSLSTDFFSRVIRECLVFLFVFLLSTVVCLFSLKYRELHPQWTTPAEPVAESPEQSAAE